MPKVSISLVTYNSEKYIPYIIPALRQQTFTDFDLYILDNDSTDETLKALSEENHGGKLLAQRQNIGFSRAHNSVINWSSSDYVLILNADVLLAKDYLAKLVKFLDQHPEVASVTGKLLHWDFDNKKTTNVIDSGGLEIFKRYHTDNRWQGQTDSPKHQSSQIFACSGTAALYRRQALEATKIPKKGHAELFEYFDEDFFIYKEDIDLGWRLRLNGWENYLLAEAIAFHDRSMTNLNARWQQRQGRKLINILSYRNHLAMVKKNSFTSLTLRFFPRMVVYELAKWLYLLLLDRSSFAGLREYFRLRPKLSYKRRYIRKLITVKPKILLSWFN